ncbi:hypothetical protein Ccrd_021065, partial [Cynara cardunculus var. scolymus]
MSRSLVIPDARQINKKRPHRLSLSRLSKIAVMFGILFTHFKLSIRFPPFAARIGNHLSAPHLATLPPRDGRIGI